jgi:putative heme iron utilization protein
VLIEGAFHRLGQRLRELRNSADETQAATAAAVELARPYLSAIEAGRKNITGYDGQPEQQSPANLGINGIRADLLFMNFGNRFAMRGFGS